MLYTHVVEDGFSVYMIYFRENEAVVRSINSLLKHNNVKSILIARDSSPVEIFKDFRHLNTIYISRYDCMETFYAKKGMDNPVRSIDDSFQIIKCYTGRLYEVALESITENILCLEPDTYIRGKIEFKRTLGIECVSVNDYPLDLLEKVKEISGTELTIPGWGFCVGLTTRSCLISIHNWVIENPQTIIELLEIDQRLENIDHGIPILAHLAGYKVGKSKQIIEVNRNRFWRFSRKPIVHQFKKFYPRPL
jgi:hypothetical protein